MDAVEEFDGSLEVLSAEKSKVTLSYEGPAHFKAADQHYCCALCRASRGSQHGGHCPGRSGGGPGRSGSGGCGCGG